MFFVYVAVVVLVLGLFLCFDVCYIKIKNLEKEIIKLYDTLEVNLKERWNLSSDLIMIMKQYSTDKSEILLDIIKLKNNVYKKKSISDKLNLNKHLTDLILKIDAEDLKNSKKFLDICMQFDELEKNIKASYINYKRQVEIYNKKIKKFPYKMWMGGNVASNEEFDK